MAAAMLPLFMMSSMGSSCLSSTSSPILIAVFFWSRVAAFFGGMLGKLNPFKAAGGLLGAVNPFKKRQFVRKLNPFRKKRQSFRKFKRIFRCFSPETPIQLRNGKMVLIKNLKLGDTLINGSVVDAVMKIKNYNDPYYKIYSPELKKDIYVTGKHYVRDGVKYVQVKNLPNAKPTDKIDDVVSCLVTSDHKIPVGNMVFWDWEDNLIPTKTNVDAIIKKIRHRKTVAQ
tara:strand:+ start:381 stop:1064 length:684 start_codon:yes stop_codon:yes gene_type:complete